MQMIDPSARRSLSENLRRLVTGRMTNDDFDNLYRDGYDSSDDSAVKAIGEFGYCLYSSDLLWPYRLKGRYAVDHETRAAAARSVLFLHSNLEYDWPPVPEFRLLRILGALSFPFGILLGIVLVLLSFPFLIAGLLEPDVALLFGLPGIAILGGSICTLALQRKLASVAWQAYRSSGEYDVWPFLRRADFDRARQHNHLLGAGQFRTVRLR
jgi:hypothetical protein